MCPSYGLGFPSLHKTCDLDQFAEATDETAKKFLLMHQFGAYKATTTQLTWARVLSIDK